MKSEREYGQEERGKEIGGGREGEREERQEYKKGEQQGKKTRREGELKKRNKSDRDSRLFQAAVAVQF